MAKIIFERQKCIGCGACQSLCSKFWKMAEDGKAELLGSKQKPGTENFERELEEIECNQEAIDNCPVQCIQIES